ncbi:MAG: Crp/Fnr family transcriptional regulator [Pseudomonadota bacterium]
MQSSTSHGEYKKTSLTDSNRALVLKLIQGWRWFDFVPLEAQQWLVERVQLKQIAKGKTLCVLGDPATAIYAVISGVFRIFHAATTGDEITLEEVVKGGWFPHIVPSESPTYAAHCTCQQEAVVASWSLAVMAEFGQCWPGYFKGLYTELGERAVLIIGRIELLSLHNLNVRMAVYLLRMARLRGVREAGGNIWIPAEESQSEVGARVGGTRQRVNSLLKGWQKRELIETHKDGTRILDLKRLKAEAKKSGFDVNTYLAGWHIDLQDHK